MWAGDDSESKAIVFFIILRSFVHWDDVAQNNDRISNGVLQVQVGDRCYNILGVGEGLDTKGITGIMGRFGSSIYEWAVYDCLRLSSSEDLHFGKCLAEQGHTIGTAMLEVVGDVGWTTTYDNDYDFRHHGKTTASHQACRMRGFLLIVAIIEVRRLAERAWEEEAHRHASTIIWSGTTVRLNTDSVFDTHLLIPRIDDHDYHKALLKTVRPFINSHPSHLISWLAK